jgi:serine/threonine protein phosphatase PrpC
LLPFQMLDKKKILVNWKEYFDNDCKGEDMWGHYKTSNGDLYVVADGASTHDGSKTGGDVARFIDDRLRQDSANIVRSNDLKELIYSINTESTKVNEGAYAAIAGILHRRNRIFSFSAGDVSIIAKKPNGKLIQVLPLDLNMPRDEAERCAKADIGTVIKGVEITNENYEQRVNQYINHGLCNAIGIGQSFFLHDKSFNAKDGAALLIASDGVTDPFMKSQRGAGKILKANASKLYEVINSSDNAEDAANAIKNLIWDTQVKEKKKIKTDDRTGLFLYMNHLEESKK